ncbi:MAG: hypothetical protein QN162_15195 [Armatimonadota bacterium]|nr:hypothetical protein [Armatimonadota bacterium]MDR7534665.1 hypothetical protein [Armatimonadota bacterium]MDR7573959.1 hypothetical protein [Armatimonadota bacterium]
MIRRTSEPDTFELRRLRRPADYRQNLVILEELWRLAQEVGAFRQPRSPDDLEADICYVPAINALRAPGKDRLHP